MFLSILPMLLITVLMIAVNICRFFDVPSIVGKILAGLFSFSLEQPDGFLLYPHNKMRVLMCKVVKNLPPSPKKYLSQILTVLEAGF